MRSAGNIAPYLSRVLAVGVLGAVVVLVTGTLLVLLGGAESAVDPLAYPNPAYDFDLPRVVEGVGDGDPAAVLQLGLLILVLTPVARVTVAGFLFARGREWVFAVVSAVVLAVVGAAWWGV